MELRVLRYFLTAVNEGNITRAADILHVTQPTLSRQLIDLERELGTTLLIRGKRSLTLTDDGMLFRQQAEEIVELADRAEQTFQGKGYHQRCDHHWCDRGNGRTRFSKVYGEVHGNVPQCQLRSV